MEGKVPRVVHLWLSFLLAELISTQKKWKHLRNKYLDQIPLNFCGVII